jgi:outer membrane protein
MRAISRMLIVSGLLLVSTLHAQEAGNYFSLKECIQYTLAHHPSLVVYDNQLKVAEKQKLEALSSYLPQVSGTVNFDDNLKRQVTVIPAGAFSPVDLRVQFGNQYNTSANVQAEQVIYDQTIISGIQANKPNMELAVLRKVKNEDDLVYNTAAAYYQVLIYKEQLKLLAENEKKLSEILAIQKLQLAQGVITQVSFNRVQVNLNNLLSQKQVAETNYTLSLARLKNAVGIPLENALEVSDSINYKQDVSLPPGSDFNVSKKPEYQIMEKNIVLQEIDLRRRRATVLPTLTSYARYGANAFGNEWARSYKNWYDYSAVGFRLNIPLFSSFRRYSQIKQSELNLYTTRQNLLINAENFKLQIQMANTQLLSYYSNLLSNKNNIELARTVFDDTSLQYGKGAASLTDFLNAEYAYKEAQTNYINSLLNYLIARIDLERSKGTIRQFTDQL